MIMSSGDDDKSPGYLVGGNQSVPMGQEITIGRADNADVRARGLWVRSLHVRIRPEGERSFRLVCISGRGVKVNGTRVESASLRFGDKIEVGRSSFRLVPVLGDEPTNA